MPNNYIVPLTVTPESNETLIAKRVIRVLDCSTNMIDNNSCLLWNHVKCPNDKDYCNPFIVGDKIYQQFVYPSDWYQYLIVEIYNATTNQVIPDAFITEGGKDENERAYLNIIIDTTEFSNVSCFYTKITGFRMKEYNACVREEGMADELAACIEDLMEGGKTQNEAVLICLPDICPDSLEQIYHEPFCQIECEQDSLLIEGYFPKYDCFGNYYSPFAIAPKTNSFKQQIRILGEISPVDNNFEVTFVNKNIRKSAQNFITHNLKGHEKVPYYVIQKIANIFASKKTIIDGTEYNGSLKLSKNNEQGKMWIIDENLTTTCGEVDFSCE